MNMEFMGKERCVGVELDELNGSMKFIVDIAVHVPKQMITKPLWDYTVRELMAIYKELHPKEVEE